MSTQPHSVIHPRIPDNDAAERKEGREDENNNLYLIYMLVGFD